MLIKSICRSVTGGIREEGERNELKNAFEVLTGTYLTKVGSTYMMIHDKINAVVTKLCGTEFTETFNINSTTIAQYYRLFGNSDKSQRV